MVTVVLITFIISGSDVHGAPVWHHSAPGFEESVPGMNDGVQHALEEEEVAHPLRDDDIELVSELLLLQTTVPNGHYFL